MNIKYSNHCIYSPLLPQLMQNIVNLRVWQIEWMFIITCI